MHIFICPRRLSIPENVNIKTMYLNAKIENLIDNFACPQKGRLVGTDSSVLDVAGSIASQLQHSSCQMFSLGSIHPDGLTGGPLLATQPLDCIGNHGSVGRRVSRLRHLLDFGSGSVNRFAGRWLGST